MADKNNFWISDADKEWVHNSFNWLIQVYGYPFRALKPVLFTEEFFPTSFADNKIEVEWLITDISKLLGIQENKFSYEFVEDIRDAEGMPYEIQGLPLECEMDIREEANENFYHFCIANAIMKHPGRLLLNLVIEIVKARQYENKISFENVIETDLLMYHVGTYLGFGPLLYQNLIDQGKSSDGLFWERKWNFISPMPIPVMAYSLALFYNLTEENNSNWTKELRGELQKQYSGACEYLQRTGNPLYNKQELSALDFYNEGSACYEQNDFENAITSFQKALFLTNTPHLRSDLYNYTGYAFLRMQEYAKSIPQFQKVLETNPGDGYANDNLGFAFIMSGDLESGKFYLNTALKTENNDAGFSYRNFALYHQKRQEYEQAEEYFQKAFNNIVLPIDLLEYFYAQFLFEIGKNEKGMVYLKKAIEKGEPEAIKLMETR